MRNPYVTGSWVSGPEHYGRDGSLAHVLDGPNNAIWIVGNRRMGKTSLLRQLEHLTADSHIYVPLYWDLQGSSSLDELGEELIYAIEDEEERFNKLVVDVGLLRNWDAVGALRLLRRYARAADRTLLLLCDEAEALLNVARTDPEGLARLRKVMQTGNGLRVVMTSTKILSKINELDANWHTSPFLFGFGMLNLTGLDHESTVGLIRQTQDDMAVTVSDELVQQIMQASNNHPYLTQVLCSRLFIANDGYLRPMTDADLAVDPALQVYFENDFRWLSPGERQTLLSVARGNHDIASIAEETGLQAAAIDGFIFSLERLSQLRQTQDGLRVGNEFLRRWLQQNLEELDKEATSGEVSDETTQQLVRRGQEQEAAWLLEQLRIQRANQQELEIQRAQFGLRVPLDLINDLKRVKIEVESLEQRLALIPEDAVQSARGALAMGALA